MLTIFLYFLLLLLLLPFFAHSQFLSYDELRMRTPGKCMQGDYDCGLGQCIPISQFRDGKPDCMDGSDEWCFIGQVSCGPTYCADYKDVVPCLVNPTCDGSKKQLPWCSTSKEKLCSDKSSFPCKGYGECVVWQWLLDGKKDCIDGSDEDETYVMILETSYRCERNKSGLVLPQPVPPPPEDHPSLFVQGCSFCPNAGPASVIPPTSFPVDEFIISTPKYPFIAPPDDSRKTVPPLNNFPIFPTEEKIGDFFSPIVNVDAHTTTQSPVTSQPKDIGNFFPFRPLASTPGTRPEFVKIATVNQINRVTTKPLDEDSINQNTIPQQPITTPSSLDNWPIPVITTPSSNYNLPPITYSRETQTGKIRPVNTGIIITQPINTDLTSGHHNSLIPDSDDSIKKYGELPSNPYDAIEVDEIKGSNFESLIPLISGGILPSTNSPIVKVTIPYIDNWTTRDSNDISGNYEDLTGPSSSMTHTDPSQQTTTRTIYPKNPDEEWEGGSSTTIKEGWIKESNIVSSTLKPTKTTGSVSVIHLGASGVIEEERNKNEESEIKEQLPQGTDSVIHVTNQITSTSTSQIDQKLSSLTTNPTSTVFSDTTKCLKDITEDITESVECNCENGKFMDSTASECADTVSLMNVKVDVNSVCNTDNIPFEEKQKIVYKKITNTLGRPICIQSYTVDDSIIATILCEECSLDDVNKIQLLNSEKSQKTTNITAAAFGRELCENSQLNHCHVYAECTIDSDGLRYACRCKKGTIDISNGYGRACDGFPEESDCVKVFGICLIVWLLFLLGVFLLTILFCLAAYSLCRNICCRNVTIYPAKQDGLQTVVIGKNARRGDPSNDKIDQFPHMRRIFAESLKNSAKGSTSVASAFALVDMRKKKVSRAPEMSQVIEEPPDLPMTPKPEVNGAGISNTGSLAQLSSQTVVSEPTTPVALIETPILEKNSGNVSLVSTNDNSPQLPNLPLPLPVPISANTNAEEEKKKEDIPRSSTNETERPTSSHSVGVQPTIWETYRVLGDQYAKPESNERKRSIDSLEQLYEARVNETARTANTNQSVFTARSGSPKSLPTGSVTKTEMDATPDTEVPPSAEKIEEDKKETSDQLNDKKQIENDSKLTEMIGESFSSTKVKQMSEKDLPEPSEIENVEDPSMEKSLEAALLIEMAKRGIELPLSPKNSDLSEGITTEVPPEKRKSEQSELEKAIDELEDTIKARNSASRSGSARVSQLSSKSRSSSAKKTKMSNEKCGEPKFFMPSGYPNSRQSKKMPARSTTKTDIIVSTDESDPEVAFFKRMAAMKEEAEKKNPYFNTRKYSRRRRPERTLSSISEKSAEIAAEAVIDYSADVTASCPPTTRTFLDLQPLPRFTFKRKVVEATGEMSDVDIPKLTPALEAQPITSSPEIPDVTLQRSMETVKREDDNSVEILQKTKIGTKKSIGSDRKFSKGVASSSAKTRITRQAESRRTSPRSVDDGASHTSRSTRHSVISKKIAIRRHELKALSGSTHSIYSDPQERRTTHSVRGTKSVNDLSSRPNWNIGQFRDSSKLHDFLPPIVPNRGYRTTTNSPQHGPRRSDSHFSINSLPATHSPISFWSSPHFNPSEDSKKPPKEDLWWNPNKHL